MIKDVSVQISENQFNFLFSNIYTPGEIKKQIQDTGYNGKMYPESACKEYLKY